MRSISLKFNTGQYIFDVCCMTCIKIENNCKIAISSRCVRSGSGSYSGGLTWSIVLRCDDHTGIFTCDGCARDPYFYVPAETQSYVIKLSCSRKVLAASGD